MKWQILMLSIATAFALALGGARWRARLGARAAFSHAAEEGHWQLVIGEATYGNNGLKTLTGLGSPVVLPGTEKLGYNVGGYDLLPDLSRIAWIDMSNYSEPQLKVGAPHHLDRPLEFTAQLSPGDTLSCPLFEPDGSVLYLEQSGTPTGTGLLRTKLQRLPPPPERATREAAHPAAVALDFAVAGDDCFEESADGNVLAFVGTDHQIHFAMRSGDGFRTSPGSYSGADFELAPDGNWIATVSGGKLVRVEVVSGAQQTIADGMGTGHVLAISPDGRWVLVTDIGSLGGSSLNAIRVSDGAPVPLSGGGNGYYGGYDLHRRPWLAVHK
ncbi:MAG TPA: hypothetical protein VMV18_10320 [bacterium]|nr:hypothetical protein [bacterium]